MIFQAKIVKNNILLKLITVTLIFLILFPFKSFSKTDFIIARVNNIALTKTDLDYRLQFFLKSSNYKIKTRKEYKSLSKFMLDKMIEEELIKNDAKKNNINVDDKEIEQAINFINLKNKKNINQYYKIIKSNYNHYNSLKSQIAAELLWTKIVQNQIQPLINIYQHEIEEILARKNLIKKQKQFKFDEIILKIGDDVNLIAQKLYNELINGANFNDLARNFSYNFSDNKNINWLSENQLNNKIINNIKHLNKNQYSKPIKLGNFVRIFRIIDVRQVDKVEQEDVAQIKQYILNEKLAIKTKSYMLNLKKNAYIEITKEFNDHFFSHN